MKAASTPPVLGLFEKRFSGDDALMELARLRFQQAGLSAELHGGTPEILESLMRFRPLADAPVVVHLPRDFNLAHADTAKHVVDLASPFAGQVYGWVLHDHPDLATKPETYRRAARQTDSQLQRLNPSPLLFIEYAAGLDPRTFTKFFASISDLPQISACIDTGHVGIRQARTAYATTHPGEDVCALRTDTAKIRQHIADIHSAAATALPAVLRLIEDLSEFAKPLHFHLHDGHPLSKASPFGVSDHLSFLTRLPLDFEYEGRRFVPPMFGTAGLSRITSLAVARLGAGRNSFTLEIHPTNERLPLEEAGGLFSHWTDKTNAERMNHWLDLIAKNHKLLQDAPE